MSAHPTPVPAFLAPRQLCRRLPYTRRPHPPPRPRPRCRHPAGRRRRPQRRTASHSARPRAAARAGTEGPKRRTAPVGCAIDAQRAFRVRAHAMERRRCDEVW
eukprot:364722-Chlamydomonas_euryale.AAC.4